MKSMIVLGRVVYGCGIARIRFWNCNKILAFLESVFESESHDVEFESEYRSEDFKGNATAIFQTAKYTLAHTVSRKHKLPSHFLDYNRRNWNLSCNHRNVTNLGSK